MLRTLAAIAIALLVGLTIGAASPAAAGAALYVTAEEVTWPDTSLGCPKPGQVYAQVLTPGFSIKLYGATQTYEIHGSNAGNLVLCSSVAAAANVKTVETMRSEICVASRRMAYWCLYADNATMVAEYRRLNPRAAPPA